MKISFDILSRIWDSVLVMKITNKPTNQYQTMNNTEKAEILAREYYKMTEKHLNFWKGNPTTFMGVGQWARHIKNCSPQLTKKIAGNFWTMKAHELLAKGI